MKRSLLLLVILILIGASAVPVAAQPVGCRAEGYPGYCFDTLPKLHCCSAAFLGWSEITVGDQFPVTGKVAQPNGEPQATALQIRFPSGRTVSLPVDSTGGFRELIRFDEEGVYELARLTGSEPALLGQFAVGYRADLVDGGLLADSQFGYQHARDALSTIMVPAGQPATLRVRFTDATGEPVRSRTLAIGMGNTRYTTDQDGIATISFDPGQEPAYAVERVYPGLAVRSYREIAVDGAGSVTGLPGGAVQALRDEGRWYLPLKSFLVSAAPLRFANGITWNDRSRTVEVEGLSILIDTGLVLGTPDFHSDLLVRAGTTYMEMGSLIRLLDQLGMAQRTGEFSFRLSLAFEP